MGEKFFRLMLPIDPSQLATAQQKGERIVKGRFIQHYIKPNVAKAILNIDWAIERALEADYRGLITYGELNVNGKRYLRKVIDVDNSFAEKKPVSVSIAFGFPSRASDPKRVREAYSFHTERPDVDNLSKTMLDRLTAFQLFADDSQVCSLSVEKYRIPATREPFVCVVVGEYKPAFPAE